MANRVAQIDELIDKALEAAGDVGTSARDRLSATQQLELLLRCQKEARLVGTGPLDILSELSENLGSINNMLSGLDPAEQASVLKRLAGEGASTNTEEEPNDE